MQTDIPIEMLWNNWQELMTFCAKTIIMIENNCNFSLIHQTIDKLWQEVFKMDVEYMHGETFKK